MKIETVTAANFENVLPLIAAYQRFYEVSPDPKASERNRLYFGRFLSDTSSGIQFLAVGEEGRALGFATLYFHGSSLSAEIIAVMNDLFTVPEARGRGVGRALIEHCRSHARGRGIRQLEWITRATNHSAQRLYDTLGAARSDWVMYEMAT